MLGLQGLLCDGRSSRACGFGLEVIENKHNIWKDLVEPKVYHYFIIQDDNGVWLQPGKV